LKVRHNFLRLHFISGNSIHQQTSRVTLGDKLIGSHPMMENIRSSVQQNSLN
jgi:hypothetical protein